MRNPAENAQLALLLEVTGTPKPGNVDRHRDYDSLRFEHFMAGAVGAARGFRLAMDNQRIGHAFERSIHGMSQQSGGNTQFGAILILIPLLSAATRDDLTQSGCQQVVEETSVEDACAFYHAFEHVEVAVNEPPPELSDLDVRLGRDAIPTIRDRQLTLYQIMKQSATHDGVAAEWINGFHRCFQAAEWLQSGSGPIFRRTARIFLRLLADEEDTFIITRNGESIATEVTERANDVLAGTESAEAFADELVDRDINPGTTADITAGGLFIALEDGLPV